MTASHIVLIFTFLDRLIRIFRTTFSYWTRRRGHGEGKLSKTHAKKTLQTSPSLAPASNGESHKMAGREHEDDLPISVRTLRKELQAYRDGMMKDIKTQIENMQHEIRKDMSSLRKELKHISKCCETNSQRKCKHYRTHSMKPQTQKEMETSLNNASNRLVTLKDLHESLTKEVKRLQDKCTDLENRSRRQNLRITGIAEGAEAGNLSCFAVEFLTELLGEENFPSPIIIDQTLAPKQGKDEHPPAMIIRQHYYSDKENILKLSRNKGSLQYKGSPVHISPDMSPEVGWL